METYYYMILFLISLILTVIYAVIWHKHFSVHYSLIFLLIPVAQLGYLLLEGADCLESALTAQKLVYLGGCFLQLFLMLSIFRLCNVELGKPLTVSLLVVSLIEYLSVLTIDHYPIFYTSVSFEQDASGTGGILIREYGIMHHVFLAMVCVYAAISLGVILYSFFRKKDVSNRTIVLLLLVEMISVLSYFAAKANAWNVELTPVAYVLAQAAFLLLMRRICLYDISDSAIDSIVQNGDTGFFSLDSACRYLGSNQTAKSIIPELAKIKVDTKITKDFELGRLLYPWIEKFCSPEGEDKFYMKHDERTYLVDISHLYTGNKKRGYQFLITDDTQNQEYIALTKSYNSKLEQEVKEKTAHIREMGNKLILDMAIMVESRDNSTGGHIRRTADCVRILMEEIMQDNTFGLSEEFCKNVIKAAPMHDLGKIAVDDAILRKPGKFEPEEFEKMKQHAAEGARIVHEVLKDTDDGYFHQIAENVAHYHHERWDGSGYPEGLEGLNIPMEARIMAIADVYDALVSKRVYKEKMSFEKADAIIMDGMGKHFDKRLEPYYVKARPKLEAYYLAVEAEARKAEDEKARSGHEDGWKCDLTEAPAQSE